MQFISDLTIINDLMKTALSLIIVLSNIGEYKIARICFVFI